MGTPSPRSRPGLRAWSGRVVAVDDAGADVQTRSGRVRATWGSGLLVASASCAGALARRGDAVRLVGWPDGRVTVEQVLLRLSA
jgi:hypothetical protein